MIRAKLTKGEIVVPPKVVAQNRKLIDAMNQAGLLMREMGGPVMFRSGGSADNMNRLRRWLDEMDLNPREEAIILKRLGIDPVTRKEMGGPIYAQVGTEVEEEPTQWYQDDRLGQLGDSLIAIGQRDFKGAGAALDRPDKAKGSKVGTKTWMDPDSGLKYKEVTKGARTSYVGVHDNKTLTDSTVIGRLVLVGTEGSGQADVQAPEKMMSHNLARRFSNSLEEARDGLLNGGGNIINLLLSRSVTATEYAKIAVAAQAAQGSDEIFRVLNAVLGQAIIKSQPREDINAYYDFMHNVSQFEVIASQASGESRLTDEDAKRYLRAIINPEATPESILKQLGRAAYEVNYEDARRRAWNEYSAQAPGTQRTEYYFNKNIWDAESNQLEANRTQFIDNFIGSGWTDKSEDTLTLGEKADGSEVTNEDIQARHKIGGVEYLFYHVEGDTVPGDIKASIEGSPGTPFASEEDGHVYYYEAPFISESEDTGSLISGLTSTVTGLVAGDGTYFRSTEAYNAS